MVNAASASPIRHAARSRGPTGLEIVRSSANGTPAPAAAHATPYPSIASATASGCRSARRRGALRGAGHGGHGEHRTGQRLRERGAQPRHEGRVGGRDGRAEAELIEGEEARRGLGAQVRRHARGGHDRAPTGARPGNPPPIPALITAMYG